MNDKEILTVEDLAKRYGIPRQTVYLWNMKGTAPRHMKIGKFVFYRLSDVIAWEDAHMEGDES